jgi:hypothetical protein
MKKYTLAKLIVFCLILLPVFLFSQEASLKGLVYEETSGEPAILANVYLKGTNYGASTDVNGYFLISKIPPGNYTLIVTYLGFDTIKEQVKLEADQIESKQFYLKESSVKLETVEVSAQRIEQKTETTTSVVKITPKEIKQIPSVGGQADFAQYLQVVPGVIFTGDQGGQFYVRGGSPIQNKVMLDGMTIYNPFHSIGLFSVFETDVIRTADVYTGGYNANYGGRISSVMDITYKDGNKKRYSGSVGASTFGARAVLEGPISRQKGPNQGSSSFILTFKNSYLAESSKIFYEYIDEDGLPFNFMDIYGKVSINAANGSKISLFGFNFTDNVDGYKSIADFGWKSYGGGTNFVVIPEKSAVLIEGTIAYSQYKSQIQSESLATRESSIGGFTAELDFTYFFGKDALTYGFEMEGYRTEYIFENYFGTQIEQIENTTQLGIFVKYKATVGKFIFEPGFRLQWYASLADVSPEPRLAIKYNVTENFRLKLAGGLYSQNFISATSDRDVVNLFYGFLSGPENLPATFEGEELDHKLQKADHIIFGAEIDLGRFVNLNIEGYYKYFPQLTNINRYKIYDEGSAPPGASDVETKDFILEKGNAYGVDVALKFDRKNLYIWLVYSLGYVNREFENQYGEMVSYTPHFDRRNNVNAIISYTAGKKSQWEFSARWNLGSGFPFTQVQGFYEYLTMPGGVNSDYTTENGSLGLIYGDLFGGRLPYYHRLDIDAKYNLYLSQYSKLVFDFSIINVYDRQNVFYVDLITDEIVYQLPIMPSFAITYYF